MGESLAYLSKHYFLSHRNRGPSKSLTGNVRCIVFFISDRVSHWTEETKREYIAAHRRALDELEQEAIRRKVPLHTDIACCELHVNMECTHQNGHKWIPQVLKCYQVTSAAQYSTQYAIAHGFAGAPVFFAFNKQARAFAQSVSQQHPHGDEYSAIFRSTAATREFSVYTIKHELLHQFGAVDLYFPADVVEIGKKWLGGSIMAGRESRVDDLTAFVIGWEPRLSGSAIGFLKETDYLTVQYMEDAIRAQWN